MRAVFAPIVALVFGISLSSLPGLPLSASGGREPAVSGPPELQAVPDMAGIDEYWGLSQRDLVYDVTVTAYSSSFDQCDDDPFITASNTRVRSGIIALSRDMLQRYNPDAPFHWGDRVHIEGVGQFIVADAMNARYTRRADIWFPDRSSARKWGVQQLKLTVPPGDSWPL